MLDQIVECAEDIVATGTQGQSGEAGAMLGTMSVVGETALDGHGAVCFRACEWGETVLVAVVAVPQMSGQGVLAVEIAKAQSALKHVGGAHDGRMLLGI